MHSISITCITYIFSNISMVSCQKGPTRHAYAWQIGPFWQDTLDMCISHTAVLVCTYRCPSNKRCWAIGRQYSQIRTAFFLSSKCIMWTVNLIMLHKTADVYLKNLRWKWVCKHRFLYKMNTNHAASWKNRGVYFSWMLKNRDMHTKCSGYHTFLSQNGPLWDARQVHCWICESAQWAHFDKVANLLLVRKQIFAYYVNSSWDSMRRYGLYSNPVNKRINIR